MAYWAVVPAAGIGARMGVPIPKQYLPLHGGTVIEHTLERLGAHPLIRGIVVAVSAEDRHWDTLVWRGATPLLKAWGGPERCHTVLNALQVLSRTADEQDWVLVHDAARPCVRRADLDRLMHELRDHPVGGLLGVPVRDTMKRADAAGNVQATLDRRGIWHALTPQMFRLAALRSALQGAIEQGQLVTDEASAMELAGFTPRLLEGHADNLKITRPEDLALAEFYLQRQALEE